MVRVPSKAFCHAGQERPMFSLLESSGNDERPSMRKFIFYIFILGAIVTGFHSLTGSSSKTTANAAAAPKGKAILEVIASKSHCQEILGQAFITCEVAVKNRGDAAGVVNYVSAGFEYSDGGASAEIGTTTPTIQPGQVYFFHIDHTFNQMQHSLLRSTASVDYGANNYYITTLNPSY